MPNDYSKHQDSSIHLNAGGNISNVQVAQKMEDCRLQIQNNVPDDRRQILETLHAQVTELIEQLPDDEKQADAMENYELLVQQAEKEKPNRKWYDVSAEGLLEAADFVQDFSEKIGGTLHQLGRALFVGK